VTLVVSNDAIIDIEGKGGCEIYLCDLQRIQLKVMTATLVNFLLQACSRSMQVRETLQMDEHPSGG